MLTMDHLMSNDAVLLIFGNALRFINEDEMKERKAGRIGVGIGDQKFSVALTDVLPNEIDNLEELDEEEEQKSDHTKYIDVGRNAPIVVGGCCI